MHVLKQCAIDDGHSLLVAVPMIKNSIYVDDTLFVNDNIHDKLIDLMKRGRFQLRKWAANSPKLLQDIPNSQYEFADHFLAKDENS